MAAFLRVIRWASDDWKHLDDVVLKYGVTGTSTSTTQNNPEQSLCMNIYDLLERVQPPDIYAQLVKSYVENKSSIPDR